MASRPAPRTMTVLGSRKVTPNMLRLTLGGQGMVDYPPGQKGGYVKLMLLPQSEGGRPVVRTYTIRDQRHRELDIDFALHGDADHQAGPATRWALAARPGDAIEVGGPGPAKPLPAGFQHYLVAGDMAALPAIAANLEALPGDATGFVALEIQDANDRQALALPPGMQVRWLVNPAPGSRPDLLETALRDYGWPAGSVYAWAACEFSAMRRLRSYLRQEQGLGSERLYLSSYWKSGLTEDAHKVVKREDAEAAPL
ncbi:Siderophore-interacting protein [Pelagerythrobacter marensis]|uniref:Siderophore-interacting protein n=2 Tax=Pelagerythrobacter marensis TaxID=543877 RepID=A0A0G3XB95_9SPHN|nr:Siderophore-interacting protein [Pelagerythrobacter marensis]